METLNLSDLINIIKNAEVNAKDKQHVATSKPIVNFNDRHEAVYENGSTNPILIRNKNESTSFSIEPSNLHEVRKFVVRYLSIHLNRYKFGCESTDIKNIISDRYNSKKKERIIYLNCFFPAFQRRSTDLKYRFGLNICMTITAKNILNFKFVCTGSRTVPPSNLMPDSYKVMKSMGLFDYFFDIKEVENIVLDVSRNQKIYFEEIPEDTEGMVDQSFNVSVWIQLFEKHTSMRMKESNFFLNLFRRVEIIIT
jgi:hypothetical protein